MSDVRQGPGVRTGISVSVVPIVWATLAERLGAGPLWVKRLSGATSYQCSVYIDPLYEFPELDDDGVAALGDAGDVEGLVRRLSGRRPVLDAFFALRGQGWALQTEHEPGPDPDGLIKLAPASLTATKTLTGAQAYREMRPFMAGREGGWRSAFLCDVGGRNQEFTVRDLAGSLVVVASTAWDAWRMERDPWLSTADPTMCIEPACARCLVRAGEVLDPARGLLVCEPCALGFPVTLLPSGPQPGLTGGLEVVEERLGRMANQMDLRTAPPQAIESFLSDLNAGGATRVYMALDGRKADAVVEVTLCSTRSEAMGHYRLTATHPLRASEDCLSIEKDGDWSRMVGVDLRLESRAIVRVPFFAPPARSRNAAYQAELDY